MGGNHPTGGVMLSGGGTMQAGLLSHTGPYHTNPMEIEPTDDLLEKVFLILYVDLFLSKSWLPPREKKVTTQRLPPHEVVRWLP